MQKRINWCTEHSKGNKTVPEKVATTCTNCRTIHTAKLFVYSKNHHYVFTHTPVVKCKLFTDMLPQHLVCKKRN